MKIYTLKVLYNDKIIRCCSYNKKKQYNNFDYYSSLDFNSIFDIIGNKIDGVYKVLLYPKKKKHLITKEFELDICKYITENNIKIKKVQVKTKYDVIKSDLIPVDTVMFLDKNKLNRNFQIKGRIKEFTVLYNFRDDSVKYQKLIEAVKPGEINISERFAIDNSYILDEFTKYFNGCGGL